MILPALRPLPIKTKHRNFLVRIWKWMTSIRKWEVVEEWEYQLPDETRVVIPKGFTFDGASIPRPLWGLLSPTGLLLVPGLIHDFGYRYDYLWAVDSKGFAWRYKKNAGQWFWDGIFRKVGVQVNGLAVIDSIAWITLVLGGWLAWRSNRKQDSVEIFTSKPLRKKMPDDDSENI